MYALALCFFPFPSLLTHCYTFHTSYTPVIYTIYLFFFFPLVFIYVCPRLCLLLAFYAIDFTHNFDLTSSSTLCHTPCIYTFPFPYACIVYSCDATLPLPARICSLILILLILLTLNPPVFGTGLDHAW